MRIEIALLIAFAVVLAGCADSAAKEAAAITGGDPGRGAAAIGKYGCGACHQIKGISGAQGKVGPALAGIKERMYVAGVIENTPENITRWIEHPKTIDEKTAMPELGVTPQEATDIAAYLYSQK